MLNKFRYALLLTVLLTAGRAEAGVIGDYFSGLKQDVRQTWDEGSWNVMLPLRVWHNRLTYDDEHIDILLESSPYYSPYTIEAEVYGTDEDCQTVAVGAVVIARNDVSEDAVYDVVSTIFNNKDAIAQSHDKGNELDLAFASSITTVPYHPGAAKYFSEQGIEVPVN